MSTADDGELQTVMISDRYELLEQLGEGGMATVYRALDTRLGREVAVKVIRRDVFPPEHMGRIVKRFEREALAIARLNHPNIVKVLDFGESDGTPFLVLEYQAKGTLKDKLGKPMPWRRAAELMLPIAGALQHAHDHHIVHRDVKPSNILLSASDEPMLSDFGIAGVLESETEGTLTTGTGTMLGTPEYMAPEQGLGKKADHRADIYSLGVVFYEMITGRTPFKADTPMALVLKHINDPLPRPARFVRDLPDQVEEIFLKMLAKHPEDRYADLNEFSAAIHQLLSGNALPIAAHSNTAQTQRRSWLGWGLCVAALILLAVGLARSGGISLALLGRRVENTPTAKFLVPVAMGTGKSTSRGVPSSTSAPTSTVTLVPVPGSVIATQVSPNDGMVMVLVPGGDFIAGAADKQHRAYLPAFWIDKTEVTNRMFAAFVKATGYVTDAEAKGFSRITGNMYSPKGEMDVQGFNWRRPAGPGSTYLGSEALPVIHVSWNDAAAYCAWAGQRLPTSSEWEKAARSTDGRKYPWGNAIDNCSRGNFDDESKITPGQVVGLACDGYARAAAPVGSFPSGASPYGTLDMAGNVAEWVAPDAGQGEAGMQVQASAEQTTEVARPVRGGSYLSSIDSLASAAEQTHYGDNSRFDLGFRCSADSSSSASEPSASFSTPESPALRSPTQTPEAKRRLILPISNALPKDECWVYIDGVTSPIYGGTSDNNDRSFYSNSSGYYFFSDPRVRMDAGIHHISYCLWGPVFDDFIGCSETFTENFTSASQSLTCNLVPTKPVGP